MTGAESPGARALIEAGAAALPRPRVLVAASLQEAAQRAAADTARILERAAARRGSAHLALTGGSGGIALADALAEHLAALPAGVLASIHLWFGDERFVPVGDGERNDLLAAPLVEAGVREAGVHRLADPRRAADLEEATALMARELEAHGLDSAPFDVIHLGLGPDAHICSLFPGHPAALATGVTAVAVEDSPKPPPQRYSLTFEAIQRAATVMVVAGGAGKARAVGAGLGSPDALAAPASCARGSATTWYLDAAAAAGAPA